MCIAVYKPTGVVDVALGSRALYDHCFDTNPDGAGLAWSDGTQVRWIKGLMTKEAFWAVYDTVREKLGEDHWKSARVTMHFRIGTHGSKNDPVHTHPFVLDSSYAAMEELSGSSDVGVVFHNGILTVPGIAGTKRNGYTTLGVAPPVPTDAEGLAESRASDTMEFIANALVVLEPLRKSAIERYTPIVRHLASGSRLLVMRPDSTSLHGDWVHDDKTKMYFSNQGFRGYDIPKTRPARWDDDYSYERYLPGWSQGLGYSKPAKPAVPVDLKPQGSGAVVIADKPYVAAVVEREKDFADIYRGMKGGWDKMRRVGLRPFMNPTLITYRPVGAGKSDKSVVTIALDDAGECLYRSIDTLYEFEPDTDELFRLGTIVSLVPLNVKAKPRGRPAKGASK